MNLIERYPNIIVSGLVKSGEYCVVESRVHGLFACLYCILYGLYICEEENIIPVILLDKNHLYYEESHGENVFNYFFQQKAQSNDVSGKITVIHPRPFLDWFDISAAQKKRANEYISKYLTLLPQFKELLSKYIQDHFFRKSVLGVHYRGRDKVQETEILPFEYYLNRMDYILSNNLCEMIFFATDELSLRHIVHERYGKKALFYPLEANYEASEINKNQGLHFIASNQFLHAKDALMECYLLADCKMLLSSYKSSMSLFATFFNPGILHVIIEP
jgi:hypothetical protein